MHPDEEAWDTDPIYCQYEWYANGNNTALAQAEGKETNEVDESFPG
jgi:hypothetical protein